MLDVKLKSWACRVKIISCISIAQERSLLVPVCLDRGEAVLDPSLGGKGKEEKHASCWDSC